MFKERMLKHLGRHVGKILKYTAVIFAVLLFVLVYQSGLIPTLRSTTPQGLEIVDVAAGAVDSECMNVIRLGGSCRLLDRFDIKHADGSNSAVFVMQVQYGDMPEITGTLTVETDAEGLVWAIH